MTHAGPPFTRQGRRTLMVLLAGLIGAATPRSVPAANPYQRGFHGDPIPTDVETVYRRGIDFLVQSQTAAGTWQGQRGAEPGVVGLAVLAMLAHGDDPNFGKLAPPIKRGLDFILSQAHPESGYIGSTMYNHGFATLALAEAYGTVDDPRLGPALKRAVGLILQSQASNPKHGWRYSPERADADTTVSGAQMVALLAARNAGIAVPDEAIRKGLVFFSACQLPDGGFGYTRADSSSPPRGAIGALVFALARKRDTPQFKAAMEYLKTSGMNTGGYPFYFLYYASQANFHADMETWKRWNDTNIKLLKNSQGRDGAWSSNNGPIFGTATALLSLALNYRYLPIYER